MIISEITTLDGMLIEQTINNSDGSVDIINYENGIEVSRERIVQAYPPLDETGALATLLVVLNVIPIEDAANVIHEEPEHLVAEAQAWSLGQ